MSVLYQMVLIRPYGKSTIIFESKTYHELKEWWQVNAEKYVNKRVRIQEAKIIKNQA